MKPSVKIVVCVFSLIALLAVSCGSPQFIENESVGAENELIGVWRITEAKLFAQPDENQEETIIKNHRPGIVIFTKSHFSWVDVHGEPVPNLPEEPTDAELAAVYNQLTAVVGTYEVKGSSITVPVIVSKSPKNMSEGSAFDFEYRFEGDIFVLTLKVWNVEFKMKRLE